MVEYHGWLALRQSLDGENEENILSIAYELKEILKNLHFRVFAFEAINGMFMIHVGGLRNHYID